MGVIDESLNAWLREYQEVVRLGDAGNPVAAQQHSFDKIAPVYKQLGEASKQFVQVYRNVLEQDRASADTQYKNTLRISAGLLLLSLACSAGVLWTIQGINRALKSAVGELSIGAEQVASAASQVSASSQSLAQGSSEQATLLGETSASAEEINSMAHKNTVNCREAASLVAQTLDKFAQTNESLGLMVAAMVEINASGERISKIIKVIDEIAFQTNILALNAAVEAARAGEVGMGFAVVANEVRNLAQRCAQAAKDTASLIEESISKSSDGKRKVDQVAAAIHDITEDSAKIKILVEGVNTGSQKQSRGIEQIGKAVSQLDRVTQSTAATAEESASAAEQLTAQSQAVKATVQVLTAMVSKPSPPRT